ncbi:MAG: phosphatase PAP2 family protein [Ignavibacteriae bacterium]|nr:phosphatase PAP2 family protein [Ignavibacteriota bacterium]
MNFARCISVIGHPFLLMPLFTAIVAYNVLPPRQAMIAEIIAVAVVIIPAGAYTIFRVHRGTWGNLDVSDQRERSQFYGILLPLLLIIVIIAWIAEVPTSIPLGALAILALVGAAFFVNRWIKVSLHTGFGVFAALAMFLIDQRAGTLVLILALLVAWSRVALGRHTAREVLLGGTLGCLVAAAFITTLRYL